MKRGDIDPGPADLTAIVEQARWLLSWHESRAAAFQTRAIGLLGFNGVALTLLATSPGKPSHTDVAAAAAFVLASLASVLVLVAFDASTVSVRGLRSHWRSYRDEDDGTKGLVLAVVAENLLYSESVEADSPLDSAKRAADRIAMWFRVAIACTAAATTLLLPSFVIGT